MAGVMRSAVMTIKVALEHRTSYTFDRPVRVFPYRAAAPGAALTPIEAYSLRVEPADHFINWQQDAVGNFVYRLTFPNPMSQLTITVGLIADLKVINPFDFADGKPVDIGSFLRPPRNFGSVILAALLVGFGTVVGSVLCVVPGLYFRFLRRVHHPVRHRPIPLAC
jgi:transglutaminase-like putative cysteine protease